MVFSGTTDSDFLKLVTVEEDKRSDLINFAANDFSTLRASLIDYVKAVYPLDYNNFVESDLGIMLIENVAYMGHVMSQKADLLANENFIRVAKNRNNIKKLLQLIGVSMKGPISAAANAKITWDNDVVGSEIIPVENRVVNITSSEDGASLSFTLYKVSSGRVELANKDGEIVLLDSEASDYSASSKIFENIVLLEGALVKETGSFSESEVTKTIDLSEFPIVEGSVEVVIEGDTTTSGTYTEVNNIFFASGGSDKVFQVVSDDDFAATVVFGDNNSGQAPRAGDTYTIFYRVGGGSRGNIATSVINAIVAGGTQDGRLENSSQGTGGADAETVAHSKRYAPLTFRRQDRLVTLQDFKTFANTFISDYGSVGKATASTRKAFSSANMLDIFVLEKASDLQLRKATPEFKIQMLTAMNDKKMLTDELVIVDGLIRTVDIVLTVRVDRELSPQEEAIKLRVKDSVLDFFSVDKNDFGKTLSLSDLNRAVFSLDEIRFSTVDNLVQDVQVDFNEIIQLNNLTININFI